MRSPSLAVPAADERFKIVGMDRDARDAFCMRAKTSANAQPARFPAEAQKQRDDWADSSCEPWVDFVRRQRDALRPR